MSKDTCDGCGKRVHIGGGGGTLWTFEEETTGGLTLELSDGTEHFLCFECIERLPDDKELTEEDIEALPSADERSE